MSKLMAVLAVLIILVLLVFLGLIGVFCVEFIRSALEEKRLWDKYNRV